jgi:hypothetical protein
LRRRHHEQTALDAGVAKLREMARRLPTVQIASELERGVSATVMKAHGLGISLRLKPKRGSGQPDLRNDPTSNFADSR